MTAQEITPQVTARVPAPRRPPAGPVPRLDERVRSDGKHLSLAGRPFVVKGVTYGSFRPRGDGQLFPEPDRLARDLAGMAALGLNVVRTYTVPPVELLEVAAALGMRVLAGLHHDDWRMHGSPGRRAQRAVLASGQRAVDEALERLAGRPEVLAVSVGNEVPADVVRVHGIRAVERTLGRLVDLVHDGDPGLLTTYSNYPTTEFIDLPGADLVSFNVFLEHRDRLRAYLRHLQVVAGDRPLLLTELGLASELVGERQQAEALDWQLELVDETGCAGATVFSWTDEWGVNGAPVEGWGFGVTRADRSPKPAADVVRRWTHRPLRDLRPEWPRLSVVVCAYNEERLLAECLDSLAALDYPDLDVVLCDDGSTDATLAVMRRYPFRVLALPHAGLSAARNAGLAAARGEVIAYLDADAACHPHWPYQLVLSLEDEGVAATGGPNLPYPRAPFVERAVAACPGGPVEVLVADDRAEHVPGCNMAYRVEALRAIGGFDPVFTSAGDDVDVCWKLLDRGELIAFAPAAQVRHHRRSSVRAYLRQQRGYGRAERMVAARHPHRFNRLGQARWVGSIYGGLRMLPSVLRPVVYHGSMGTAPYQTVTQRRAEHVLGWYAALLPLSLPVALAGLLLAAWHPAGLLLALAALLAVVLYAAGVAVAAHPARGERRPWAWRALLAWLHVAQPLVRAWGRVTARGLPPQEQRVPGAWTGDRAGWLATLHQELSRGRASVRTGAASSRYDLHVTSGPLLRVHVAAAVAWSWTPCAAVHLRPRWALLGVTVTGCAVAVQLGASPVLVVLALTVALAVETAVVLRLVRGSISRTTSSFRTPTAPLPTEGSP